MAVATYKGFSTVNNSFGTSKLTDTDLIKRDLLNHFAMRKGEKLMNGNFGTSISDMLMDPLTEDTKAIIIQKVNDVITVQVISTDNKGLTVKPENCELEFLIKKSNIALNTSDARPSRFVGGERIDAAISELNMEKRKASLSIKLLEELQNKEAVTKFSSPLSGKNLPFSSLSEKLGDKKNKDNE